MGKSFVVTEAELHSLAARVSGSMANSLKAGVTFVSGDEVDAWLKGRPGHCEVARAEYGIGMPSAGLLEKWAHNGEYTDLDKEAEAFASNFTSIPNAASRGYYVGWRLAIAIIRQALEDEDGV